MRSFRVEVHDSPPNAVERVPAAVRDSIVSEVFSPELERRGFREVNRQQWVRSLNLPIREVVVLQRHSNLTPVWGLSLAFVPDIDYRVQWHRAAKTARLHLSYDPLDYDADWKEFWSIETWYGRDECSRSARSVLKNVVASAEKFFASVRCVPDLPEAFEAKRNRPFVRFGFENYPQESLAYAFVLARCGRKDEARTWFSTSERHGLVNQLTQAERIKLDAAFESVVATSAVM